MIDFIASRDDEAARMLEILAGKEGRVTIELKAPSAFVLAFAYYGYALTAQAGDDADKARLDRLMKGIASGRLTEQSKEIQAAFVVALNEFMDDSYHHALYEAFGAAFAKVPPSEEMKAALARLGQDADTRRERRDPGRNIPDDLDDGIPF